jgi:septum formation protein
MDPVILASCSPRRYDFFKMLGLPFISIPSMIDETPQQGKNPRQLAEDLALKKVLAVAEIQTAKKDNVFTSFANCNWIFGADTIVVLEGDIFGKPDNRTAAREMLSKLAGKQHEVITAIALYNKHTNKTDCRSVSCDVEFASLTGKEIEWYLNTGEWEGAAGAYRLQEKGGCLIKSISGSPSAVAGLPLHDFYVMLKDNGYCFGA